jgi:uncharacterized membrane protein
VGVIPVSEKIQGDKYYSALFESNIPYDLFLMLIGLGVGIVAIYLPLLKQTPLGYGLPLPLLLFIPGYCLIAALFPQDDELDLLERMALSVGLSIAVIILIGLGLSYTPWGIRLESVIVAVTTFSLGMILIAHYRRNLLPHEKRLKLPIFEILGNIREEMVPAGEGKVDRNLSILLSAVVLITILTIVFVIIFPNDGERFSEFYILSQNHTSSNYPDHLVPGTLYSMYIGVGNQEQRNVTYTIEIWSLQTKLDPITNTSHIQVMDPSDKITVSLGHNESRLIPYALSVRKDGYDRVEFLLFNDTVPGPEIAGNDRINASYRDLHLWMTV